LIVNFDTKYDLVKGTGVLHPSTINIGNAKSNLNGTYKSAGDDFAVDLKIAGEGLPAPTSNLPPRAGHQSAGQVALSAGTMNTNLHVSGPTNKLVTDGNIGLFNENSRFDLGQKLSASRAGGNNPGLIIEKFTNDYTCSTGLRADNSGRVVPALAQWSQRTVDAKNNLDFKLVATVNNNVAIGGGGSDRCMRMVARSRQNARRGAASCKNGCINRAATDSRTTASPQFCADIGALRPAF